MTHFSDMSLFHFMVEPDVMLVAISNVIVTVTF